jgi:hypothetical protein
VRSYDATQNRFVPRRDKWSFRVNVCEVNCSYPIRTLLSIALSNPFQWSSSAFDFYNILIVQRRVFEVEDKVILEYQFILDKEF